MIIATAGLQSRFALHRSPNKLDGPFFFLETVYFPSTYFHFKRLQKSSLRPLSGCSYPLSGLSSGVFSGELRNRHGGTCTPSGQSATSG